MTLTLTPTKTPTQTQTPTQIQIQIQTLSHRPADPHPDPHPHPNPNPNNLNLNLTPNSEIQTDPNPETQQSSALSHLPPLRIPSFSPIPVQIPSTSSNSNSRFYNAVFSLIHPQDTSLNYSPSDPSHHFPQHHPSIPIPRSRPTTIGRARQPRQSLLSNKSKTSLHSSPINSNILVDSPSSLQFNQRDADQLDLLDVLDPAVRAASTLTHIQNSLFLPPSINHFRSPLIELQNTSINNQATQPVPPISQPGSDPLDDHLVAILDPHHRRPKMSVQIKRISLGIWAFMATPIGILFTIYGFLVVFWGAALVLILFKWLKLKDEHQYRIWVEICSQILNGLFTITGIGLLPSRMIDWYHASIILHYAHQIWRRHGRSTLEDPNDIVPPPSTTNGSLPDVWKEDSEIVLSEIEVARLRKAQEKLCRSQTWYRPHSSATHYAFPIRWTLVILAFNLGNSFFQAGLCGVMWGLTYTNRPAWTTGTLMGLSFSCGLASALLIWRISVLTLKSKQVYTQVEEVLASGSCGEAGGEKSVKQRKVRSSVVAEHGSTVRGTEDLPLVGSESRKSRSVAAAAGGGGGAAMRKGDEEEEEEQEKESDGDGSQEEAGSSNHNGDQSGMTSVDVVGLVGHGKS